MLLTLKINHSLTRTMVIGGALLVSVCFLWLIYGRFLIGILSSKSTLPQQPFLSAARQYFPTSARLESRNADLLLQQVFASPENFKQAELSATRAVQLAPFDANNYLLLAAVKGVTGDLIAEESALREALALAPNNTKIHWRLANVLLRNHKIALAVNEFRATVTSDPSYLPLSLELLWQLLGNDLPTLQQTAGELPKNQIYLAQFLLQKAQTEEGLQVLNQIDPAVRLAAPEIGNIINDLLSGGKTTIAYQLWQATCTANEKNPSLIWNGSFETASPAHLAQFDWQLRSSEYAQLTLDSYIAHTGTKSLRLDFAGRDTTRLGNEVRQLMVLRPGARYRLSCFVRTSKLFTPEGPRLAITSQDKTQLIASSNPINAEESDWQPLAVDFVTPANAVLSVTILRNPKTSYDEPTQGTIWFDDFSLVALP